MPTLSIITAPDPRLKLRSEPVAQVDDALRRLMDEMLRAMYGAPGIGLSAVQVGVPRQVIVADCGREDAPRQPLCLVNPRLVWFSDQAVVMNEGCLSLPEHFAEIERPERCRVEYLDYHGKPQSLDADGLLSRCVQHEYDHLDGTLFVDRISALKRNMILRKLVKARRQKAIA